MTLSVFRPTDGIGMAKKRRSRGMRGAGAIDQLPSGRWRLRVPLETGGRATYGTYVTEELAAVAQSYRGTLDCDRTHLAKHGVNHGLHACTFDLALLTTCGEKPMQRFDMAPRCHQACQGIALGDKRMLHVR